MFIVFKNIFNVIFGDPKRIELIPYVTHGFIETAPGITSNIGTSFGVYYLIGGYPFTLFMTALLSIFTYIFYYKSFRSTKPFWIYLNLIFLTSGMLSFFGQYFTTFAIYEMTAIFFIFIFIFRVLNHIHPPMNSTNRESSKL